MVYENAKGLRMKRVFTFYQAFQAAEYRVDFENIGSGDLPTLSDVNPLDLWYPFSAFERLVVHTTGTGEAIDAIYPVPFWTLRHVYLLKDSGSGYPFHEWSMSSGDELADRGAHRPMALLEDEQTRQGMFMELGWGGTWQINFEWVDFKKTPFPLPQTWGGEITDTLHINGGVPKVKIRLHPGEKIFLTGGVAGILQRRSTAWKQPVASVEIGAFSYALAGRRAGAACPV